MDAPLLASDRSRLLASKAPSFVLLAEDPPNGGPDPRALVRWPWTPTSHFFVRCHAPVPAVDVRNFRLVVDGGHRPLALRLDELLERFPQRTMDATLQCAGNRRLELMRTRPMPGEIPWGPNGIGTGTWTGVRLRDLLAATGVPSHVRHVAFTGTDVVSGRGGRPLHFGGSIAIDSALDPQRQVLLAHRMNGAPLEPVHGFPLRVVAPGIVGARSVKWLWRIELRAEPSDNEFQRRSYLLFPPEVEAADADPARGRMLEDVVVNAAICAPADGAHVAAGRLTVLGWASPSAGARLTGVEVSADGGRNWRPARLSFETGPNVWRLWEARLALPPGAHRIMARARDSRGATQPADVRAVTNFRGYLNHAQPAVRVQAG